MSKIEKLMEENANLRVKLEEKDQEISYLIFQMQEISEKINSLEREIKNLREGYSCEENLSRHLPPQINSIIKYSLVNCSRQPKGRRYEISKLWL